MLAENEFQLQLWNIKCFSVTIFNKDFSFWISSNVSLWWVMKYFKHIDMNLFSSAQSVHAIEYF